MVQTGGYTHSQGCLVRMVKCHWVKKNKLKLLINGKLQCYLRLGTYTWYSCKVFLRELRTEKIMEHGRFLWTTRYSKLHQHLPPTHYPPTTNCLPSTTFPYSYNHWSSLSHHVQTSHFTVQNPSSTILGQILCLVHTLAIDTDIHRFKINAA